MTRAQTKGGIYEWNLENARSDGKKHCCCFDFCRVFGGRHFFGGLLIMDEFNKRRFFARGATHATSILSDLLLKNENALIFRDSIIDLMVYVDDAVSGSIIEMISAFPEVKR
jgi:hypothetical protein